MFEKATQRLVQQIDPKGSLIAVSRVNDSKKLKLLSVVIKRPPARFWQKSKYRPTTFTFNDLLQGDPIQPALEEDDMLKYKEKREGTYGGLVEADAAGINIQVQAQSLTKLSSSLGMLRKDNLILQKLIHDSKDRKVDLKHSLIQQTLGKNEQVFALVTERIFTSCECTIEYSGVEEGNCFTVLKALGLLPVKALSGFCDLVSLKQSNDVQFDTNVQMDILPGTVLAYSIIPLDIKSDGHYELQNLDGYEADDIPQSILSGEETVDGLLPLPKTDKGSSLSALKEGLSSVKNSLCELTHLPPESRSSLLCKLQKILLEQDLLSTLEDKLEELCSGQYSCLSLDGESNELIDSFLELLLSQNRTTPLTPNQSIHAPCNQNGFHAPQINNNEVNYNRTSFTGVYLNGSSSKMAHQNYSHSVAFSQNGANEQSQAVLTAMHMLISAAEGLTYQGLRLLLSLCSSEELRGLSDLVNLLTESSQPLPFDSLPAPLQSEDVFVKVEKLFHLSKVKLHREKMLWAETECREDFLPVGLCVAIHGLAYLTEA